MSLSYLCHEGDCGGCRSDTCTCSCHGARVVERTPTARTTDPPTGHMAAAAVVIKAQTAKARLLLAHHDTNMPGLTDEQAALAADLSLSSEYATRCSELRNLGLLQDTEVMREGLSGQSRLVRVITTAGIKYVQQAGWRDSGTPRTPPTQPSDQHADAGKSPPADAPCSEDSAGDLGGGYETPPGDVPEVIPGQISIDELLGPPPDEPTFADEWADWGRDG